ncbi:MAG TPA: ATP-binding protein [Candidatus Binataceae bacterium]|nr:ATP-binding protein [Candidatus Binataceae bacterium]
MKRKIVPTQNIAAGVAMINRLSSHSQPLGLIYGGAGLGKTALTEEILKSGDVVYVRACEAWRTSRGMMLKDILNAVVPRWGAEWHSTEYLYRTLLDELRTRPNLILLLDESDYLARGKHHDLLNAIRDLADGAGIRVVFISINSLARLLASPTEFLEAVSSRIGGMVEFRRCSLADASLLARELVEGVAFEREVIVECLRASNGSIRVLLGLFAQLEQRAHAAKLDALKLTDCVDFGILAPPATPAKASTAKSATVPISLSALTDLPVRSAVG